METLGAVIEHLLARLIAGEVEDYFRLRTWAARHSALPVMADMGGCYAIKKDGNVVAFLWDKEDNLESESDARLCRTAMKRASQLYPLLARFVPQRPVHALDCRHCAGTGRFVGIADELAQNVVCYCGGLGWLLEGEDTA